MDGKSVRSVRRQKHLRQERIAWTVAIMLLLFLAAAVFYGGFFAGYSWQRNLRREELLKNPSADGAAWADNGEGAQYCDENWNLVLVNKWNPVPDHYEVSLVEVEGGECVDERIYKPLMEMLEAAREANRGRLPLVVSGYRTGKKQQRLYDEKIAEYRRQGYSDEKAEELAQQWVALPGYSEHQLGFAVDINGVTYDVYLWLQENSYKYGFIYRYPGNKTEKTGIAEEVWHYRYVGVKAAAQIYEQGICLEEYLENMDAQETGDGLDAL